jgi:uncharacterized membrane protein (DUF441 family)
MDLLQIATVGGITGLVLLILQVGKQYISNKYLTYIPGSGIVLGIILSFIAAYGLDTLNTQNGLSTAFFVGVMGGLAATGTYENTLNKLPSGNSDPSPTPLILPKV